MDRLSQILGIIGAILICIFLVGMLGLVCAAAVHMITLGGFAMVGGIVIFAFIAGAALVTLATILER